jgi:hypothetical protein
VYSVGVNPTRTRVRSPVAWIVGRKETESRKSIDKAILGMGSKSLGRNESKRIGDPETLYLRGRAPVGRAKAAWNVATDWRGGTLWRGGSDSTMTRMHRATGEALLAPSRNRRSREPYNRRNREIGKRREGDGRVRSSGEAE